ncbi:Ankyrin repeat-containing domain,Ankyrin repeat [Cinara cedri]|uniref:Ankyrin repeat-containing domain,Ankyrin repeat n=1 Tax=Cinara cedri TaxID=506608 RepID=A0A5E4NK43_9HEMI|nr:Ankyrin repeat-containing domain,Ankyrin repeat [Cinara cedri]
MEDFIAMTKKKKVTKAPIALINQNVTGTLDKENHIKKGGVKNMWKGFIKGSKHTNKVTKEPMTLTNQNIIGVTGTRNNGAAQTNQATETSATPIEMDTENDDTVEKKVGIMKKLKVLIFDKKYISNLTGELKEINGKLLKNNCGKIDEARREKLVEYNIRLENNTLLEVIHKNKKYNYNTTPLLLAVKSNLNEVAKAILRITSKNLDIQDNEGMNVLHYAVKNNDKFIVDTLLQKKLQVDVGDKKGKTALHHAAENNCDSIVETLLQHGANINALDKNRKTPLFYALTKNHSTLASFMIIKEALLEIEDKDNEEIITYKEKKAEINQDYDGEYEMLVDTSLDTRDVINTSEDEDPFDEQSTTSCDRNFDDSRKSFIDIPLPKSTSEENPPDEQSTTSNITHNQTRKHSWTPLRKMPSQPNEINEAKGAYKIVILVASAAAIITASMLAYFTTLPALAIIGISYVSAMVFGSIATLKPMSKVDDTDCSKVCDESKNLFV